MAGKNTGKRGQFQKEKKATKDILRDQSQALKDQLVTYDKIDQLVNDILKVENLSLAAAKSANKIDKDTTKEMLEQRKLDSEALDYAKDMVAGVRQRLQGLKNMRKAARAFNLVMAANPMAALAIAALAIVTTLYQAYTAARDFRKEIGGSLANAAKTAVKLKSVQYSLYAIGASSEDVRASFDAIRQNFGGTEAASFGFIRNLTKASQVTGVTADTLAQVLSIQESISDASRDTLLAQIEASAYAIELKGIAPEAIFKDLAENADFFATNMKAGTTNVRDTAIEARKLGLNLGTVAKISESLLDFESSIEKQMEASVLLGRQLNLDKARQLSFMDDQQGMMQEILRQVGGEAEFGRLKGFQRRALADAVGVSVSELSRLAKQKEGDATAPKTFEQQTLKHQEKMLEVTTYMAEDIEKGTQFQKKTSDGINAPG